jgi:hypothetical protein
MLTRLIAQASAEGHDLVTIRAMVEEASDIGAARALTRLGLADEGASGDIAALREVLSAWRDAKASAWKSLLKWIMQWAMRGAFALFMLLIALKLGQWDLVR